MGGGGGGEGDYPPPALRDTIPEEANRCLMGNAKSRTPSLERSNVLVLHPCTITPLTRVILSA